MDACDFQVRAHHVARLLHEMGNAHRLMILHYLVEKERSVGELVDLIGVSQSAVSQHLARLRNAKLVNTRRSRQTIYYSLQSAIAAALLQAINTLFSAKSD